MIEFKPAVRPDRYRLYIDESGDHTYNKLDHEAHRYLTLLGCWFKQPDDYSRFADKMEEFKREIFGHRPDDAVILHRKEIMQFKGPFGVLQDPKKQEKFNDGLIDIIKSSAYNVVCVVIDKKKHLERYKDPVHPYHYCLSALIERYVGWLNHRNSVGDVLAEARGTKADTQLSAEYSYLYQTGTHRLSARAHQRALTSGKIKLKKKIDNIAGLQLCDSLAYPCRYQLLLEQKWFTLKRPGFSKPICEAVASKLAVNPQTGNVYNFGKIWLP